MKFNIKQVIVKDLSGNVQQLAQGLDKSLGDFIYISTASLDWLEKAKAIHSGSPVELSALEAEFLISLIQSPGCKFINAIKQAIITSLQQQ